MNEANEAYADCALRLKSLAAFSNQPQRLTLSTSGLGLDKDLAKSKPLIQISSRSLVLRCISTTPFRQTNSGLSLCSNHFPPFRNDETQVPLFGTNLCPLTKYSMRCTFLSQFQASPIPSLRFSTVNCFCCLLLQLQKGMKGHLRRLFAER